MKEKLIVANLPVDFMNLDAKLLKGITLEMRANFNFFQASIAGQEMILLRPKQEIQRYTPLACQKMQLLVEKGNGKPSAFWFNALDFNQRTRLVEKGVYFIVSGKYAFLPNMILNSRSTGKRATEISAPAQYVLLYHLQEACLEGRCAKDLAEVMPYKYNTLSLAMQVLEDLGLCSTILGSNQEKRLHFELRGDDLWQQSLPFLMSPVVLDAKYNFIPAFNDYSFDDSTVFFHFTTTDKPTKYRPYTHDMLEQNAYNPISSRKV